MLVGCSVSALQCAEAPNSFQVIERLYDRTLARLFAHLTEAHPLWHCSLVMYLILADGQKIESILYEVLQLFILSIISRFYNVSSSSTLWD